MRTATEHPETDGTVAFAQLAGALVAILIIVPGIVGALL